MNNRTLALLMIDIRPLARRNINAGLQATCQRECQGKPTPFKPATLKK